MEVVNLMNNVTLSGRVSNLADLKVFAENKGIAYIPVDVEKEGKNFIGI